jgi:hypothetical protein
LSAKQNCDDDGIAKGEVPIQLNFEIGTCWSNVCVYSTKAEENFKTLKEHLRKVKQ